MSGDLQIATIVNPVEMAQLEAEWSALADVCPTATVFQTYEWNSAWWRHFGRFPGRRLQLVTFRAKTPGRELIGLAPLMTGFLYASLLRRLSFIGTGSSDYLDLLAAPGYEEEVSRAFYPFLSKMPGWHVGDFQQLRETGLLRAHAPNSEDRLTHLDVLQEPCPYLDLPSDWETLTQRFGKKTRSNIGYYDRALAKVYEVDFGYVTETTYLEPEMARLFDLHQRRWNQRWLPGVFNSAPVKAFHRDLAQSLLKRGWLRLFYLRLDGETQACLYCFAYGDRICYYQGGFEPTLAKLSLGTILTARAMQTAINEKRQVFDFLRGDEPYKAKWTGTTQTNLRRLITHRGTPMGPFVRIIQRIEQETEHRAKEWARKR